MIAASVYQETKSIFSNLCDWAASSQVASNTPSITHGLRTFLSVINTTTT